MSTHDAREALRKANRLANRIQGKSAGYGLALEDLLKNKGPELLESKPEATHSKNIIELFKHDYNVPSRDEFKEKTASKLRESERIGTDGNESSPVSSTASTTAGTVGGLEASLCANRYPDRLTLPSICSIFGSLYNRSYSVVCIIKIMIF